MYSFPPFFTRQPNAQSWAAQSTTWQQLVLDYCRAHRIFRLEMGEAAISATEIWSNKALNRRVSAELQREIVDMLVKAGSAIYDPPPTRSAPHPPACFVLWRNLEEWGQIMYADVMARGETNSIMTLFELQQGDATPSDAEYRDMPIGLLRLALQTLARTGRAQVFKGTGVEGDGEGVKFV